MDFLFLCLPFINETTHSLLETLKDGKTVYYPKYLQYSSEHLFFHGHFLWLLFYNGTFQSK